jgi:copper chaperone CopZ
MAVKKALSSLQGVRAVDVDLASGRVVIESESAIDPSLLKNAVAGAGYEAL